MSARAATGYSGTPLVRKLGIKEGTRLLALNAPLDYGQFLGRLPPGAQKSRRGGVTVDIVHLFADRAAELRRQLTALRRQLRPDAAIWVSWPKRTSKVPTDITEDVIRDIALPMGFVDIKVCAVTEVWSGLKLVVRKELR